MVAKVRQGGGGLSILSLSGLHSRHRDWLVNIWAKGALTTSGLHTAGGITGD